MWERFVELRIIIIKKIIPFFYGGMGPGKYIRRIHRDGHCTFNTPSLDFFCQLNFRYFLNNVFHVKRSIDARQMSFLIGGHDCLCFPIETDTQGTVVMRKCILQEHSDIL